eukprot:TRINITY_DN4890_c0_g1_i1.p1 TRINITY_DN4890_c0_g1~~TRINITY_DN4890_c0_g1_i1.p1  ORF type:complete len:359 (-),score=76.03 TRINITY_DN4890_c0_g1_i1:58-1134(-)
MTTRTRRSTRRNRVRSIHNIPPSPIKRTDSPTTKKRKSNFETPLSKLRKTYDGSFMSPRSFDLLKSPDEISNTKKILDDQRIRLVDREEAGKHAVVLFGVDSPVKVNVAIKKQLIKDPKEITDRSYKEAKILDELLSLKESEYYPNGVTNFIESLDWFKGREGNDYIHYIMECADHTLEETKLLPLNLYRSIVFQVLFAIYVAQTELQFVHNDLHLKNILLKDTEETITLSKGEKSWYITKYLVKIADFGLSRLQSKRGVVLYDVNNKYSEGFYPTVDVEKFFSELKTIQIEEESWYSETEVAHIMEKNDIDEETAQSQIITRKKKQIRGLKNIVRQGNFRVERLLSHSFFNRLKREP